jgi:hypothetical protein
LGLSSFLGIHYLYSPFTTISSQIKYPRYSRKIKKKKERKYRSKEEGIS